MKLDSKATFVAHGYDEEDDLLVPAPEDGSGEEEVHGPVGRKLSKALSAALGAEGWTVLNRWTTPYGRAFDVKRSSQRYDVELRRTSTEPSHWQVAAAPRSGLIKKKSFSEAVTEELALLQTHLDGALRGLPGVSDLAWVDPG
ncbi:MAG: hypothetical protein KC635_28375 [Myxococcales bacterium]|nr:hypothetical protein [Myxococcales bacterium]